MKILETERLILRQLTTSDEDARFVLELVNEPGWIQNIGDRNVHSIEDARNYIANNIASSYERNGFGLYAVMLKETNELLGMCGLIKRDTLDDVDIGFAFLQRHWSKGYAFESARAVMELAKNTFGLTRVVAITIPSNQGSIKTLEKIGLRFEKIIQLPNDDEELMLFAWNA
jgi:RimJ/RimL family protein N-acetyltransferase